MRTPSEVNTMTNFTQSLLLALFVWRWLAMCQTTSHREAALPLRYTREALMALRSLGITPPADLPKAVKIQPTKVRQRKRGRREGNTAASPAERKQTTATRHAT